MPAFFIYRISFSLIPFIQGNVFRPDMFSYLDILGFAQAS